MKLSRLFRNRKSRKYPIRRDEQGLSLRTRCFALFDQGKRPAEVAEELKMKETTVFRYYRQWKRQGPNFETQYAFVKSLFKKTSPEREKNLEIFSKACGVSKEEFENILSKPHGLRSFLTGQIYFPINADADHKLSMALQLALLFFDHLVKNKGKFEDVYFTLKRYLRECAKYREEEDDEITEENKILVLLHKTLAADLSNERKGRVKPDRLSEEERAALVKRGIASEMKKIESLYWIRVGVLMAEGLTEEQARERIYQDIEKDGDPNKAKAMREFQDKIHPLKINGQEEPPVSPPQL